MKSRWYSGEGDGGHPPVEMRFVDMFMTALGSLIFIALLLVFLLPQTAQPSNIDTPKLQSELARLRQELAETQAKARQSLQDMEQLFKNVREVDKDVVKRWLSVSLLRKDCPPYEPTLYVRWEGPIADFATGKRLEDMARFDASDPRVQNLVGRRYFLVGPPSSLSTMYGTGPTSLLNGTGLVATSYFTVSNAPGPWSIYIGLRYPRNLGGGECTVHPIIHGSDGQAVDSPFKLSLGQPFAWVRRVRLENNGGFTSPDPTYDAGFLRELEAFSAEQSEKLCEKKSICGTQDAHWARYAKPAPPPPEAFDWKKESRFRGNPDHYVQKTPIAAAECRNACVDDLRCSAVEYDSFRASCSLYERVAPVERAPGSRRSVGIRERLPLHWQIDHTVFEATAARRLEGISREECASTCLGDASCAVVEYYKPARACSIFAAFPKIVRSPIGPYAPTDVGVKTKR